MLESAKNPASPEYASYKISRMSHSSLLTPGVVSHISNRGNNGEVIFIEERNYHSFMKLHDKYITPVAEPYANYLLRNHFRLMVRIRYSEEVNESA